jgi:hypothetical protein
VVHGQLEVLQLRVALAVPVSLYSIAALLVACTLRKFRLELGII